MSNSTVMTWGSNNFGQLGDGYAVINPLPKMSPGFDVAPSGGVSINDGAGYASNPEVTLALPATDDSGSVAEMCISSDGVFDTEPWQPYSSIAARNLGIWDGTKHVYAIFGDTAGNISEVASASIVLDTSGTVAAALTPLVVAAGDYLTVNATVNEGFGATGVTANGVALTESGAATWTGRIAATGPSGLRIVNVVASDGEGGSVGASASYRVMPVVGASCKSATDSLMSVACNHYLLKLWGRATVIDSDSFWIGDGYKIRIRVVAPGCAGIADNDFVSARGVFDPTTNPPTLTCPAGKVIRQH